MTDLDRRSFLKRGGALTAGTLGLGGPMQALLARSALAVGSTGVAPNHSGYGPLRPTRDIITRDAQGSEEGVGDFLRGRRGLAGDGALHPGWPRGRGAGPGRGRGHADPTAAQRVAPSPAGTVERLHMSRRGDSRT